jgi:uncharacterized protein YgiM (DUF1202 family)
MGRRLAVLIAMVVASWMLTDFASAEKVYVQAKTAQLRAGKTSLDKVTADVRFGDELDVLKREGNWVEVKTSDGQRGWIFGSKLSRTDRMAAYRISDQEVEDFLRNGRLGEYAQ